MLHRWLLSALACSAAVHSLAQITPSEYATFTSHGKAVSCPVYQAGAASATLLFLPGTSPEEVLAGRQSAQFFAGHGFRVLLLDYASVTPSAKENTANYRRWAEVVEDIVADLRAHPMPDNKKIVLAGQGRGGSVVLVAAGHRLDAQAIAEWSGQLPNQFFAQVEAWPPLLIVHGDADQQVPIVNARQLIRVCQLRDFTCETQIYVGEGHIFSPRIADQANERVLAFFRSYLH